MKLKIVAISILIVAIMIPIVLHMKPTYFNNSIFFHIFLVSIPTLGVITTIKASFDDATKPFLLATYFFVFIFGYAISLFSLFSYFIGEK